MEREWALALPTPSLNAREVLGALQKPPECLVPCCAAPQADVQLGKVPHEDQGLQMRSFLCLSEEGLICCFFLIWLLHSRYQLQHHPRWSAH